MLPGTIRTLMARALRSTSGNVAVLFAVTLPLVVGGAGLGVETTYWRYRQTQLQTAADAAAYAAAVEMRRGSGQTAVLDAAKAAVGDNGFTTASTSAAVAYPAAKTVEVALQTQAERFFTAYFSNTPVVVRARATANYTETGQACILALDPAAGSALNVSGSAHLQLQGCSIMANSISATAATTGGSSTTIVPCIVSGGGVSLGGTVNLTECAGAIIGAAQAADPYKTVVPPPPTGNCKNVGNGATTLTAGYYCGLQLNKSVTFEPGTYYVAGEFRLNGGAEISGDEVTFILVNGARVDFNGNAKMNLKAKTTGPYAGILFFGDRASSGGSDNVFNGSADSLLTGALYFPTQAVEYKGNFSGVGGCTQVVAKTIEWTGNATISQNCTSLGLKSVPIPGAVRLVG
jgi:Flp pilus assembly protein TadG